VKIYSPQHAPYWFQHSVYSTQAVSYFEVTYVVTLGFAEILHNLQSITTINMHTRKQLDWSSVPLLVIVFSVLMISSGMTMPIMGATGQAGVESTSALSTGTVTASTAETTTVITECTVIDEPGSYELGGDLIGDEENENCIDIAADDVHLDGQNNVIRAKLSVYESTAQSYGIEIVDGYSNVTIENARFNYLRYGVFAKNATDVTITNNTFVDPGEQRENGGESAAVGLQKTITAFVFS